MEKLTTHRTSRHTADILEPIIIEEKDNTRRVFLAYINDTKVNTGETVAGTLVYQRKKRNDEWGDIESINLASLKGGEGVKIKFNSSQLRKFYLGLKNRYELSADGRLAPGEAEFAVAKYDEIIKVPKDRRRFISELLSKKYGEEIWEALIETDPDLATRLSFARLQTERREAIVEFEQGLKSEKAENYWQKFFEKNQWIFGYGLKYHFTSQLSSQPLYGGTDFTGSGGQKGDYLLKTEANIKFTVLVEIKKPNSKLLATNKNGDNIQYRNGAWLLSSELLGGVSQVQANCKTWQQFSVTPQNIDKLDPQNIFTISPKGILLIGNTAELTGDREKIETFESFRRSTSNPEIITYDELFERARFIVEQTDSSKTSESDDRPDKDDVPF